MVNILVERGGWSLAQPSSDRSEMEEVRKFLAEIDLVEPEEDFFIKRRKGRRIAAAAAAAPYRYNREPKTRWSVISSLATGTAHPPHCRFSLKSASFFYKKTMLFCFFISSLSICFAGIGGKAEKTKKYTGDGEQASPFIFSRVVVPHTKPTHTTKSFKEKKNLCSRLSPSRVFSLPSSVFSAGFSHLRWKVCERPSPAAAPRTRQETSCSCCSTQKEHIQLELLRIEWWWQCGQSFLLLIQRACEDKDGIPWEQSWAPVWNGDQEMNSIEREMWIRGDHSSAAHWT